MIRSADEELTLRDYREADPLGTAKRLAHDLLRPGRVGVLSEGRWQVVVRSGEHREQTLERREIALVYGRDRFLDEMIAGDNGRIGCAHHRHAPLRGDRAVASQPAAPLLGPAIVGGWISEETPDTSVGIRTGGSFAEAAEGQGEISAVLRHALQQTLGERHILGLCLKQTELASETLGVGRFEAGAEAVERLGGLLDGGVLVPVKERQERFREPGEVPAGDARLVPIALTRLEGMAQQSHSRKLVSQSASNLTSASDCRVGPGNFTPSPSQIRTGYSRIIRLVPPHEGCRLPLHVRFLPLPVDPTQRR